VGNSRGTFVNRDDFDCNGHNELFYSAQEMSFFQMKSNT